MTKRPTQDFVTFCFKRNGTVSAMLHQPLYRVCMKVSAGKIWDGKLEKMQRESYK